MNPRVNRNNSRRTEWAHFHSHVSIKIKLGTTESRVSPVLNFPHLIIRSFAWTEKCCLWVFLFLTSQRFKGGGAIQFNSAVSRVVLLSRTLCKICQIATVHSSDLRFYNKCRKTFYTVIGLLKLFFKLRKRRMHRPTWYLFYSLGFYN